MTRQKAAQQVKRAFINWLKQLPCADCGQSYPPYVMDFDHVRGTKLLRMNRLVAEGRAWKLIFAEIQKCEIVCANCHRKRTFTRGQHLGEPI